MPKAPFPNFSQDASAHPPGHLRHPTNRKIPCQGFGFGLGVPDLGSQVSQKQAHGRNDVPPHTYFLRGPVKNQESKLLRAFGSHAPSIATTLFLKHMCKEPMPCFRLSPANFQIKAGMAATCWDLAALTKAKSQPDRIPTQQHRRTSKPSRKKVSLRSWASILGCFQCQAALFAKQPVFAVLLYAVGALSEGTGVCIPSFIHLPRCFAHVSIQKCLLASTAAPLLGSVSQ